MTANRRQEALRVRNQAAQTAYDRDHPRHLANADEQRYACDGFALSFTKGLEHDPETGLLRRDGDFLAFRRAIDEGFIDPFTANVPVPDISTGPHKDLISPCAGDPRRPWEAPTAGTAFDLQGPDAQAVTMAPAPALGSLELIYEMAEVYELALLRDVDFSAFSCSGNEAVLASCARLNAITDRPDLAFPTRPRKLGATAPPSLTAQTLFRGSSPGVEIGPYVSQFLLIGSETQNRDASIFDGKIVYGAQVIDQQVPKTAECDWMRTEAEWLAVQDGTNTRDDNTLFEAPASRRFITTPRDLATYVHDDALYQAYLNACLILLRMNTPFDPAFAQLSGQAPLLHQTTSGPEALTRHAGGFALYGGPHILSLVTEVATRALKAVRYQKFNNHIRLRPETLAGRIHYVDRYRGSNPQLAAEIDAMAARMSATIEEIRAKKNPNREAFLPMAFQEGSPMHPAYGAGHATVAGACVTILKAFFDTGAKLVDRGESSRCQPRFAFAHARPGDNPVQFVVDAADTQKLKAENATQALTLEGELNKLAANISIGRNMGGVHYYSDYYDSVRMGEEIAIGILEEQALTYPTDPFVLSVPTFDGDVVRIGAR